MASSAWWAASGSAALLLALGSMSSTAHAAEQVPCQGADYESYACFLLGEKDIESTGTICKWGRVD